MTQPARSVEQDARDRLPAVALTRPAAAGPARGLASRLPPDLGGRAARPSEEGHWLPTRPDRTGEPDASTVDRVDADVQDVAARGRSEALAAAATSYSRRYGHPLDHPGEAEPSPPRRWWLSARHAVVAGTAVVVLTTGVVVRAAVDVPGPPVPIVPVQAQPAQGSVAGAGQPVDAGAADVAPRGAAGVPGTAGSTGATATPGEGGGGQPSGGVPDGGASPAVPGAPGPALGAPGVVVHVVGRVPAPAVLTLPAGSRVGDAVAAAGGPAPDADLSAVNLARVVVDGEQIHVPAHGEAPRAAPAASAGGSGGAGGGSGAGGSAAGPPLALNTADLAALDALPGIGPVLARRILDWRTSNGPFRSVDELAEVSGIGDALLSRLRPLVRV